MARVKFVPPGREPARSGASGSGERPPLPRLAPRPPPGPPQNANSGVQNSPGLQEATPDVNPQVNPSTRPNEASAGNTEALASQLVPLASRPRQNAVSGSNGSFTQVRTRATVRVAQATSRNLQQAVSQGGGGGQRQRQGKRKRGTERGLTSRQTASNASASNASSSSTFGVGRPGITIFQGILMHAHLIFHFANCLDLDDFVGLYAISKDFHEIINSAMTAVILAKATLHAPTAAAIFPFRCYRKLCIDDPLVELDRTRDHQSRLVPSFRWLRMVCWREEVVNRLVALFNNEGLWLPKECETAIKKVWFLMDIPDNRRRIATIQNRDLWTTSDLFHAIMFFMRIDMRCINPIIPVSHGNIRRMLLAQPTMSIVYRVMARTLLTNTHEALQMYLRWKYIPRDREETPVLGVPRSELGKIQYENYGAGNSREKLQRPDELVMKECVRRGLNVQPVFFQVVNLSGPPDAEDVAMSNAPAQ